MYEVFINQHSVIISNSQQSNCLHNFKYFEAITWDNIFQMMNGNEAIRLNIYGKPIHRIWHHFKANFKLILAAGGVVIKDHQMLFIFRNGKWDLPKGKLEHGEKIEGCAIREVQEECGLGDLFLDKKLTVTYHVYSLNDELILKETHWYLLHTEFDGMLRPQSEEGIEKVQWFEKESFTELMQNSYQNIKKVIDLVEL